MLLRVVLGDEMGDDGPSLMEWEGGMFRLIV